MAFFSLLLFSLLYFKVTCVLLLHFAEEGCGTSSQLRYSFNSYQLLRGSIF